MTTALVKYSKLEILIARAIVSTIIPILSIILFTKSVLSKQKLEFYYTGPFLFLFIILGAWTSLMYFWLGMSVGWFFSSGYEKKRNHATH